LNGGRPLKSVVIFVTQFSTQDAVLTIGALKRAIKLAAITLIIFIVTPTYSSLTFVKTSIARLRHFSHLLT
jgi:hypothetical protein